MFRPSAGIYGKKKMGKNAKKGGKLPGVNSSISTFNPAIHASSA